MTLTVQERVANGVRLLDEKRPGWDVGVVLEALDLWTAGRCILGQVYGAYSTGVHKLKLNYETTVMDYGFNAPSTSYEVKALQMDALEAEWIRVITERREKVTV